MYEQFGIAAISNSVETNLLWGGDRNQIGVLQAHGLVYSSTIADAGNTPTTAIRAGLLVGVLTSSGELEEWDADAVDGTQNLYGVVPQEFSTLDEYATAVDKIPPGPIVRAPLVANALLIEGNALTGHANEFLARETLHRMGCVLDDDPQGYLAGVNWRRLISTGDVTLTSANNATWYIAHSADADFTLPTIKEGLKFRFTMGEDFELQISSPASNFLLGNDQTGDGVTYTTAGEQIGADVLVEAINMDIAGTNTLVWKPTRLVIPFSTDDYFATTLDT